MSPGAMLLSWVQGLRKPVTSMIASGPRCKRVLVGRARRSTPEVVTFSPRRPGLHLEAAVAQLGVDLGVHQVHLSQIRLRRIARDARAVLDGGPEMRVAFDPEPGEQLDGVDRRLGERVRRAPMHCDDYTVWNAATHRHLTVVRVRARAIRFTGADVECHLPKRVRVRGRNADAVRPQLRRALPRGRRPHSGGRHRARRVLWPRSAVSALPAHQGRRVRGPRHERTASSRRCASTADAARLWISTTRARFRKPSSW